MRNLSASDVFDSAQEKFFAGKADQAYDELRSALEYDEYSGQLWELLGQVCYTKGIINEALHALEYASLLIPLSACGQLILGRCYEKTQRSSTAKEIYQHLATLERLDSNLLEPLAKALGRVGDFEAALQICREAATRFPESPEPLMGMACYMRRLGLPAKRTLPCLFRAHHLNPEDMECRKILAWILHANGRSNDAAHLLSVIPLEEHQCRKCLAGMQSVFTAVEDFENAKRCVDALRAMTEKSR